MVLQSPEKPVKAAVSLQHEPQHPQPIENNPWVQYPLARRQPWQKDQPIFVMVCSQEQALLIKLCASSGFALNGTNPKTESRFRSIPFIIRVPFNKETPEEKGQQGTSQAPRNQGEPNFLHRAIEDYGTQYWNLYIYILTPQHQARLIQTILYS